MVVFVCGLVVVGRSGRPGWVTPACLRDGPGVTHSRGGPGGVVWSG